MSIIICSLFNDFTFGCDNYFIFSYFRLLDGGNISNCFLVRQTFCYLFGFIASLIFYKIETKYYDGNDIKIISSKIGINSFASRLSDNELIYEDQVIIIYPYYKLLFIIFLWVLEEQLLSFFKVTFSGFDFWMLELIIIHFFMSKILKMKVYGHQRLMLWFCIIPFSLKLTTIILSYMDENN